jgi:hypothetical protein
MDLLPPNAGEIKKLVEARIAAWRDGMRETYALENWRGARVPIPVVRIPIEIPYYNPNSRRIQAQKDVDRGRCQVLDSDPYSDEAQNYLDELLQWDPANPGKINPEFERLQDDLRPPKGQLVPGLMTREGILVNGNTRRSALRKIGAEDILVAILPEDTCREDIDRLERRLQIRKDIQLDYSFVNGLLAVSDFAKDHTAAEVFREFGMRKPRLERSLWLLDFIDGSIARSATTDSDGNTVALRRSDFERDQGQLEELYRAWHDDKNPDTAALLAETRLIGVVLDLAKTDLRVMQSDFIPKYIAPKVSKSYIPDVDPEEDQSVPGLDDVKLPGDSVSLLQVRALADAVLRAEAIKKQATLAKPAPEAATQLLSDLTKAYRDGRIAAEVDQQAKKKGQTPATRIVLGSDQLDLATSAVAAANASRSLDIQSLEDSLETLRQSIIKLAQVLNRVEKSDEMDVGFAWLQAAVNVDARSYENEQDGS